jgi:hypothetical protein
MPHLLSADAGIHAKGTRWQARWQNGSPIHSVWKVRRAIISRKAVELAFGRLEALNLQPVGPVPGIPGYPLRRKFRDCNRFNVPGWRNRQTQRT